MADTGYKFPTDEGDHYTGGWTTPTNVFADDGSYAIAYYFHTPYQNDFFTFGLGVPAGATIDGIEVTVEAIASGPPTTIQNCELSWNHGTNYTTSGYHTHHSSLSAQVMGGPTDTWGRSWSADDFSDANFYLLSWADVPSSAGSAIDYIKVKVYYTAAGGGTQNNSTISNILVSDNTKDNSSKANFLVTNTQDNSTKASIVNTLTKDSSVIADLLTSGVTKDNSTKANLLTSGVTKNNLILANLLTSDVTKANSVISNILAAEVTYSKDNSTIANIYTEAINKENLQKNNILTTYYCGCSYDWNLETDDGQNRGYQG